MSSLHIFHYRGNSKGPQRLYLERTDSKFGPEPLFLRRKNTVWADDGKIKVNKSGSRRDNDAN